MSHFTLFTHKFGPNGWRVTYALEELGLTYDLRFLDFSKEEHKAEDYVKYNPNGRTPTLVDHKCDNFTIWESGAILTYLTERYDPEHKISAVSDADKFHQLQWLFFQSSGQVPYVGEAVWYLNYHPENVPSAIERYRKEVKRVFGVLDGVLSTQDWLVAGKVTVSDLAFIGSNEFGIKVLGEDFDFAGEFPHAADWHKRLQERPAIRRVDAVKAAVNQ